MAPDEELNNEQENDIGITTNDLMLDTVGKYVTTPIGGTTVLSVDDEIPR